LNLFFNGVMAGGGGGGDWKKQRATKSSVWHHESRSGATSGPSGGFDSAQSEAWALKNKTLGAEWPPPPKQGGVKGGGAWWWGWAGILCWASHFPGDAGPWRGGQRRAAGDGDRAWLAGGRAGPVGGALFRWRAGPGCDRCSVQWPETGGLNGQGGVGHWGAGDAGAPPTWGPFVWRRHLVRRLRPSLASLSAGGGGGGFFTQPQFSLAGLIDPGSCPVRAGAGGARPIPGFGPPSGPVSIAVDWRLVFGPGENRGWGFGHFRTGWGKRPKGTRGGSGRGFFCFLVVQGDQGGVAVAGGHHFRT